MAVYERDVTKGVEVTWCSYIGGGSIDNGTLFFDVSGKVETSGGRESTKDERKVISLGVSIAFRQAVIYVKDGAI